MKQEFSLLLYKDKFKTKTNLNFALLDSALTFMHVNDLY